MNILIQVLFVGGASYLISLSLGIYLKTLPTTEVQVQQVIQARTVLGTYKLLIR